MNLMIPDLFECHIMAAITVSLLQTVDLEKENANTAWLAWLPG